MLTKPQANKFSPFIQNRFAKTGFALKSAAVLGLSVCFLAVPAAAQNQTNNPPSQPTQNPRPGDLPPATTQLPPNSSSAPIRPGNEAQQSTQPQPGVQQERQQTAPNTGTPRPQSPQIETAGQQNPPSGVPNTSTPPGTANPNGGTQTGAPSVSGVPLAPGQSVGSPGGIAPADLPADPPPVAPNFEAPPRPLPSAERVGVDVTNQLPITLEEAITFALQNNNDIDSSRINVQIAEFNLTGARGVYDPIISNESYYESRTTPTSSTIGGAGARGSVTQTDFTSGMRFGGFTPFAGGSYQADFSSTRLTTNNQNVTLNPQFPTALSLSYTQPLWRGLRFDNNRRNIEIAKKNLSLTDAQFRQQAIEVISQVEQAYWDLVFALRNLQVQIDAVKQARTQLESNQRLVSKGALAPIEIVAATTQVTTFEQNVYTAQESVTRAENTLKTLMLKDRTSEVWMRPLTPVTQVSLEAPQVGLEQAVGDALQNRPEIAQLQTNAEINSIDERFFRDQTKPQIDLIGTYTAAGLAGARTTPTTNPNSNASTTSQLVARVNQLSGAAGLPPLNVTTTTNSGPPSNLVGGYFNSLGNLIGQDFPTYRVGVRFSLPLKNRTAEANLGRSLAAGSQIKNQRAQAEQVIEADVRNALQALRSAEARLQSAAATRASNEQLYESEQRQFKAGTTTVYLVFQRQTELLAARGRELQAQTDLNKAISAFQRATGTTLTANHVSITNGTRAPQFVYRPTSAFSFLKAADGKRER
ncbi:MAG TPA: TolC family protein [Pyrinomonadaceae bacterium]|nr:TolC family protein [Pyrinomonadaceae bacterium]